MRKQNLSINKIEALCITLRRLAYPSRLQDVGQLFGRCGEDISNVSNSVIHWLHQSHMRELKDFSQPWVKFEEFAQKISSAGSPLPHCFGFIDGTVRPMCRPSKNQKAVYNGHKKVPFFLSNVYHNSKLGY